MSCMLGVQPKPIQKAALLLLPEAEAGGCRSSEVLLWLSYCRRRLEEKSFSLGQQLSKFRLRSIDDGSIHEW